MPDTEKEAYVRRLFSSIAPRYDLLNTIISLTRHRAWRRYATSLSGLAPEGRALDVCCGTGDFALELARVAGERGLVVGADFAAPMLELARRKASRTGCVWVSLVQANACRLPFADGSFDCVTVGFGLRNVADLPAAISEMARVIRPGGRAVSLEICGAMPRALQPFWRVYFDVLAPVVARLFRGKRDAYEYLPRSVRGFLSPAQLAEEFQRCGLTNVEFHRLMFGAVYVHIGTKPEQVS